MTTPTILPTHLPARARRRPGARSALSALLALLVTASAALVGTVVGAAPAHAAARVTVTNDQGRAEADATYATTLTLSGSGFQSIQGAFGGVYVFFGWVSDPAGGSWAPSRGGSTGADYRYVPDSEQADNQGFQRFVAFPGSDTEYAANGGVVAADGTWSTQLVVPGPTFQALDRSGNAVTVDCREVQCGVITIGAHGVPNANNETFTPVAFTDAPAGGGGGTTSGATSGAADQAVAAQDGSGEAAPAPAAAAGTATIGVDQATAVAGRALSFVAQGFQPGEQVVAVLDDGVLAVGPLTAGNQGEVAGLLELPADLRVGTHVLRLTGAGSGLAPEVEITVRKDPAAVAAEEAAAEAAVSAGRGYSAAEIAVGVAALVLLLVLVSSFVSARRRRRAARADEATAGGSGDARESTADVGPGNVTVAPSVPAGHDGWHDGPRVDLHDDAPTQSLPPVVVPQGEPVGRHA
ncbi:hypothetical protein JOE63_003253 [Cellulosimicrobium cellulans]|uniref:hypothetical protein n=1 Tax=Cellulosimicrobium cellulans TaxID=1710 RepID=UPI0019595119|nr:hypothetical protein [Cellulosimicrobium cellulans]MBM7820776.1 hypothetical protein [Cellulosimicrobium cellulans]